MWKLLPYRALLKDLKGSLSKTKQRASDKKVPVYWEIGRRIIDEAVAEDVGYYSSVIKDLAKDLRVSTSTFYDAVGFAELYGKPPNTPHLNWSHHRALMRLGTKKARSFYSEMIREESLSARALEAAIDDGLHQKSAPRGKPQLRRPKDPEFV